MAIKNKKAANGKTKNRAPETNEPDDALLTQTFPKHEEIQRRAYEIHLLQGATDGRDLDDWLRAEGELRGKGQRLEPGVL